MNDPIRMTWREYRRNECLYRERRVRLSPQECEMLAMLLLHRGQLVSYSDIIGAIWPNPDLEPEYTEKVMHQLSHHLRHKMPGLVRTVFGRGFMIEVPERAHCRIAA
jgi:DNA-binding response OmpR family regulator